MIEQDKIQCNVYIDEAGDLGIARGTRWFVISAVIVDTSSEAAIRNTMSEIRTKLNIQEIHMRKVQDFYKRAWIVKELNQHNFVYINILADTTQLKAERIPDASIVYNYLCKYLLQRVSWYLDETGRCGNIILSSRGTSRDAELISYITEKLIPYPHNDIAGHVFDRVTAKTAASWDLLQLADVCATAMFLGHEISSLGFTTPCYNDLLESHLYRRHNAVQPYGIKYFTNEMIPDKDALCRYCVCQKTKKEETPGTTATCQACW